MLYPAQTSMMPVNVALARFLEINGLGAIFSNYPYWYLGSTPFRYLSGPVLPLLLSVTHRLLPNLSLFEIFFFLVGLGFLLGGGGVYLLVRELSGEKKTALLAAFFYLFGPIVPLLFPFSDGVYLLAFSTLPFILFCYLKFLKKPEMKLKIFLISLVTFVLLLDTLIIPSLFLGMTAIFLVQVGWKNAEVKLKKSLWLIAYGLLVTTLWYTPGYWWTLLTAPSFGGKGLGQVILWLGKLMPAALALTLAVFSARFFKKRDLLRDFCFFWLFIFGFLTLIRFLSDWDFWQDWTGYGVELQLGMAMGLGLVMKKILATTESTEAQTQKTQKNFSVSALFRVSVVTVFIFGIWLLLFNKYVLGTLQKDITQTVEYRVGNWLSENIRPGDPVKSPSGDHGARVFLSGTTAFWLNSLDFCPDRGSPPIKTPMNAERKECEELVQVRGGRDQASLDPNWREATWEIRDGATTENTERWLKTLKITYVVVHTKDSQEYYHDFKNPGKFEAAKGLKKVFSDPDSTIYMVEE